MGMDHVQAPILYTVTASRVLLHTHQAQHQPERQVALGQQDEHLGAREALQ